MTADTTNVRVYTVNGAAAGSSSSLPDWLVRKRAATGKGKKRIVKEHLEGTIELIQGFEFPEASNRVKTTRDGHHVIATGTYKPQMRVWDLDQLSLKFERHSDAENVDFVILSDDWTKTVHLQNDRTIELHTQGGFHYRTRIPRFGRSMAYHFPSCDTYISASGNEIYRLNLDQGRFLNPLVLEEGDDGDILGVNVIDINPVHHLLAFGVDGNGTAQFWDPRSRTCVGTLRLPRERLMSVSSASYNLSVTAIASRADGLSYAVGTSTGHTLLYDIRAAKPFATKDQGYGLPVKNVTWIEGGSRMAGDGMVLSADKKVVKIWDRNDPASNFASITPATDLNDIHHVPGSGVLMSANEGIQMCTYFIPQLGPAPRWASFLENITEEMEDQTTRSVYEDYKFVERNELKTLGLDHLIGTPALKPYMHGYFLSLKLYDTARIIANPFAYEEHREKLVRDKLEKEAETRIRAKKEPGVKVNKALAEKVLREEEKAKLRAEKKSKHKASAADSMEVDSGSSARPNILSDPRFAKVFEDPAFAIDETSREYALLNPSSVAQSSIPRGKTAVEEEEEESDKQSSDGLGSDDESEGEASDVSSDSSAEGELTSFDPRSKPGQRNFRAEEAYAREKAENRNAWTSKKKINMVPIRPQSGGSSQNFDDKAATFGQRRAPPPAKRSGTARKSRVDEDAPMEISWVPSSSSTHDTRDDGDGKSGGRSGKDKTRRKGVETFGAGLERGIEENADVADSERQGRTQRRKGIRSGSKNVFRRMDG
ncbi:NUC153 and WD40 repeat-containing nucleolar rRNA processing-related protein [Pholiota conissans]|uniref:NUC153 and WD40 repeat-containing nucleolar rRNA processing-related protein n=1 Tax=Pholiota conissans TaxID=109636 RepID=A0A9P5Z9L3_9AGAR|nr:NUC153 and WD40 repeat-containing nucleolar rRNA processing-related protein [Pholiota conissans]